MTVASLASAATAYREALARVAQPAAGAGAAASGIGAGFSSLLRDELGAAASAGHKSESLALKALTGKADVQAVVQAVTAAELGLQTVTAVRDKVIAAYQDIMRMPI